MYLKYNNVLRSFSGDTFLMSQAVYYKLAEWMDGKQTIEWSLAPTKYATTIHAINSAIVKLAPLTVAAPVFRGIAGMRLPDTFFERDSMGLMTGTECARAHRLTRTRRHALTQVHGVRGAGLASRRRRATATRPSFTLR